MCSCLAPDLGLVPLTEPGQALDVGIECPTVTTEQPIPWSGVGNRRFRVLAFGQHPKVFRYVLAGRA